jgi:hypothetical protein
VPNPGDAKSFDRYSYVAGNPIKFNDPSGHDLNCGQPGSRAAPEDCQEADPDGDGDIPGVELTDDREFEGYDGTMLHELYLKYARATNSWWYDELGSNADGFTIRDFMILMLFFEMAGAVDDDAEGQEAYSWAIAEKFSFLCDMYKEGS